MKARRVIEGGLDAFGVWLFIAIAVGAFIGYGAMLAGMVAALR